ncbi:MAG: FtsX-like permease family protein [Oscillospiraceae bacterium]|nr:FtsX-like permease family protein [Oscillospiraceae bacterium]
MVKTLLRSALREIRQSTGRYLAILAIVGLGVGFFAGLRACQPSMMATGVDYLDRQSFYDFRLLSTLGFTEEDLDGFASLEGIKAARGAVYTDFLTELSEGSEAVVRAHSLTEDINLPSLSAGRMPEQPYECLGDAKYFSEEMLGRTLQVAGDNDEDTKDLLVYDSYTIVGLAWSPAYLNYERGTSSVGSGSVAAYIYIPQEGFDFEVYHEVYLTMEDAGEAYSHAYDTRRDELEPMVEALLEERAETRYDTLYGDAMAEIRDAEQEIADGWSDYHREKADAENELDNAYRELTDGESDYEQGQRDYEQGQADYEQGQRDYADGQQKVGDAQRELADAEQEVADGEKELADARKELDDGWAEYNTAQADAERELAEARQKLEDGEREYQDGLADYNAGLKELEDAEAEIARGEAELRSGQRQLDAAIAQLDASWAQLESARRELEAAESQLRESESQYNSLNTLYQTITAAGGIEAIRAAAEAGDQQAAALLGAWNQAESQLGSALNEGTLSYLSASIASGWSEYNAGLQQYQYGYAQYQNGAAKVEQSRRQLREAQAELDQGKKELADGQKELAEAKEQLDDARKELDDGWAEYNSAKADADRELAEAYRKLTDGEAEYADGLRELEDGQQKLEDGRKELADAQRELEDARRKLNEARDELDRAPGELEDARHELDSGWTDYQDGRADAQREFADAEQELTDAERELADAREKLQDLKPAATYLLTREENTGYACFENDTSIVAAISVIFPAFFFLVAALVCMTTMTRMVDEQRTQIGVLKALGYSKGQIMSKYLFYSGSAALAGSLAGYSLGVTGLPWIIWEIYGMIYGFAPLQHAVLPDLASLSFAAALLCSVGATWLACRMELKRQASELIRPKTPRAGRRVFLEYITPLWKRLSFLYKVSARNVLRYRSRLIMMVLGIGGCTALLCTGFGIRDSIAHVADDQFDEITLYDYTITFQDPQTWESADAYVEKYGWEKDAALLVHSGSVDVLAADSSKSVYLVISSTGSLDGFLSLHNDEGPVAYPETGGAVLNAGLAESLGIVPGDTVQLRDGGLGTMEVTVSALCDNYVFNYVYLSAETFREQLGAEPEYNTLYLRAHEGADPYEEGALLLEDETVSAVTVNASTRERVDSMLSRLDYIVVVIVLCAAALAFIVLYNLTNINITERLREIATIKVLGFYQNEVASYVFREINILSVLGSLAGLGMGKGLHAFVMAQIKIDSMTFACRIAPASYLISFAMTLLFTVVISMGMRPRLRRIDMAESLKSIE